MNWNKTGTTKLKSTVRLASLLVGVAGAAVSTPAWSQWGFAMVAPSGGYAVPAYGSYGFATPIAVAAPAFYAAPAQVYAVQPAQVFQLQVAQPQVFQLQVAQPQVYQLQLPVAQPAVAPPLFSQTPSGTFQVPTSVRGYDAVDIHRYGERQTNYQNYNLGPYGLTPAGTSTSTTGYSNIDRYRNDYGYGR
jgi:hypothetical protein